MENCLCVKSGLAAQACSIMEIEGERRNMGACNKAMN